MSSRVKTRTGDGEFVVPRMCVPVTVILSRSFLLCVSMLSDEESSGTVCDDVPVDDAPVGGTGVTASRDDSAFLMWSRARMALDVVTEKLRPVPSRIILSAFKSSNLPLTPCEI